jgi:hypothetical protein
MKGMITGLTLDDSVNDLARKFNIALEVCPLLLILLSLLLLLSSSIPNEPGDDDESRDGAILDRMEEASDGC